MSVFVFILGLVVGSFVNVLVYRLPRGQGIVRWRSRCPYCRQKLWWVDLIPVISFLWLGGQCRYCQKTISWRYPVVELISGVIFWLSFLFLASQGVEIMIFYLFFLELFLVLALIDLTFLLLPDKVLLVGAGGALLYGILEMTEALENHLAIISWSHLTSALFFLIFLGLMWLVSKGKWLGLGDAKLMGLIGLVFGWPGAWIILYTAVVLGGIISLGLYLSKRAGLKTKLPFGTFICAAAGVYIFAGVTMVEYFKFYLMFR